MPAARALTPSMPEPCSTAPSARCSSCSICWTEPPSGGAPRSPPVLWDAATCASSGLGTALVPRRLPFFPPGTTGDPADCCKVGNSVGVGFPPNCGFREGPATAVDCPGSSAGITDWERVRDAILARSNLCPTLERSPEEPRAGDRDPVSPRDRVLFFADVITEKPREKPPLVAAEAGCSTHATADA